MRKNIFLIVLLVGFWGENNAQNQILTKFETSKGLETVTYAEGMAFAEKLDAMAEEIKIFQYGSSDGGTPLSLIVFSADKDFDIQSIKNKKKTVLLINNAIHAGEPDGVDASLMLLRNLIQNKKLQKIAQNTVICVIPFYNIDGVLNRNSTTRVNQDGPKEFGFRGNAKNYDLNRDFVKCDSKNAQTFTEIFHTWQPDMMIDNHVSNGADYQYTLTYLAVEHRLLGGKLGEYHKKQLIPALEKNMLKRKTEMCPYVDVFENTPDKGYAQSYDSPRYSTGYVALFNCIGLLTETHMLKPFKQRVEATYQFLEAILDQLQIDGNAIQQLRKAQNEALQAQNDFVLDWVLNEKQFSKMIFKGYQPDSTISKVSGLKRLSYDRKKPFSKEIPFFDVFDPLVSIKKPAYYIVPKAYKNVMNLLTNNKIVFTEIQGDTELAATTYYIDTYKTRQNPFEGHYLHYNTQIKTEKQKRTAQKGDYKIEANQAGIKYLMAVLEPQAPDSFFNWNFFDTILQQKEGFSDYVFEDLATEILKKDTKLKEKLEEKRRTDANFAKSAAQQLNFVYQNSQYREKEYLRYPIFRVEN